MRVVAGKVEDESARMASPSEARSISALFMAIGARPDEIDGAVTVLIELSKGRMAPRSYQAVAEGPLEALAEYRRRTQFSVVDAEAENQINA